jgi:hypothetical protein
MNIFSFVIKKKSQFERCNTLITHITFGCWELFHFKRRHNINQNNESTNKAKSSGKNRVQPTLHNRRVNIPTAKDGVTSQGFMLRLTWGDFFQGQSH